MSWGDDGSDPHPPPLLHDDWAPRPVPPGSTRAVSVVLDGFHGLPTDPILVAWDDARATVRLLTGELRWYVDTTRLAFPREDGIAVVDSHDVYPRGNRFMDALAVRSLLDLVETVNADRVVAVDEDGTIHIDGEHDDVRGQVVRDPDSGIVLRASGVTGDRSWRLDVVATRQLHDAPALLGPGDVTPPTL